MENKLSKGAIVRHKESGNLYIVTDITEETVECAFGHSTWRKEFPIDMVEVPEFSSEMFKNTATFSNVFRFMDFCYTRKLDSKNSLVIPNKDGSYTLYYSLKFA